MQALKRFQVNCILIVLMAAATNWWLALPTLEQEAQLGGPLELARSTDICIPSSRVPPNIVNPALYRLQAYMLTW
jgi:hypothetical protein